MFKKTYEDNCRIVYKNTDTNNVFEIYKKDKAVDLFKIINDMEFYQNYITFEEVEFLYKKIKELENLTCVKIAQV